MESANSHHQHHQLQDQLLAIGSSPLATPTCYGVGSAHSWTPNTILNTGNFINPNINGSIINSRNTRQQNDILVPSLNGSMIQDLGLQWPSNAGNFTSRSAHDLHLERIKEELSDSYPKFTQMINSESRIQDFHSHQTSYGNCASTLTSIATPSRANFSQIFPTVNISNMNQSSSEISNPSDMNLKALDLFNSARLCGNSSPPSHHHLGPFKESTLPYDFDQMQQSNHRPSNSRTKMSTFTNGVKEAKRPSSVLEPKAPQAAAKKSRLESRASYPPFKVRKEKLGDRIAALQQLVAPFGKTDTASVLMEAVGYIKFLQNQVETLSVPYMKSSRNRNSRTTQRGLTEDKNEESRRDLRSRGLCLVPLSCLSYITDGGGVWPPPNFGGGT
ncbi:hypothetical protein F0562_036031 [Nyssa sinensis]|uniref:BHLH domain-containing protein n=1 Tax=Nyssa sinensis TaxID=561372 RepID=A0A5J5AG36_9ASTE|nr:hypothetical protein F0562_036031 [Nyssa sinensis]